MENCRRCDVRNIDVHGASMSKHQKSKKPSRKETK